MFSASEWWCLGRIPLVVFGCVVLISVISKFTNSGSRKYSSHFINLLKSLTSQSVQFHNAALQDTNPLIGLMHANYALAYLMLVHRLGATDADVNRITNVDISELQLFLENDQKRAIQRITSTCPACKIDGVYTIDTNS